jgi:hypothetical protein
LPADAIASDVPVEFVNPFNSVAYVGLSELSASGLWAFLVANLGDQIVPLQSQWTAKNLRGGVIVRIHPADFDGEMLREFPSMAISVRVSLFNFVKTFVARDLAANHALKSYVDDQVAKLWADSSFETPVAKRQRVEIAHGGGNDFVSPPKRTAGSFVFGSPPGIGTAVTGTGAPPFGNVAPPSLGIAAPSSGSFAPSFGRNALPSGEHALPFGGNVPPPGSSALFPGVGAPPLGSNAPPVSQLQSQFNSVQSFPVPPPPPSLLHNSSLSSVPLPVPSLENLAVMLRAKGANPKPWELADSIRPKQPDDDFVPGFKRISMFALIEQAQAKAVQRRSRGESVIHVQKDIVWPKMHAFSKQAFLKCRTKFYECILQSLMSGIFSTFKECVLGPARIAAMREFRLTEALYLELDDKVFVDWLSIFFGPKHKAQALATLSDIQIGKHSDTVDSQALFVAKLDTLAYDFELAVNDIFNMSQYWPSDPTHEDFGMLSLKEVSQKWLGCFPVDRESSSIQIAQCRAFLLQNKDMLFDTQVARLRAKFTLRDTRVLDGDTAYTTTPTKASNPVTISSRGQRPTASSVTNDVRPRPSGNNSGGGGVSQRPAAPLRPTSTQRTERMQTRSGPAGAANATRVRVTPGHQRCKGCGAENNHWGLGFTKDSCPAFGTKHAVKPGFVWLDSDRMPKVNIPQPEYQDLLRANPKIQQNWNTAKASKAAARGSVMALDARDSDYDYDDDGNDVLDEDNTNNVDNDVESDHADSHEVNEINCFSSARSPGADLAQLSTEDALQLLGNMQQFFAVSRLAGNDEFVAKTLMDPGATMNIISPMCCNRCMVDRRHVQVNIFQGKRKVCTVEEIAKCCFELQDFDGNWHKHTEWFGVHEIGYEMLLGRRFCKDNGFTSLDEKLTAWATPNDVSINALDASHTSPSYLQLLFSRVHAPLGQARYKRAPKRILADVSSPVCNIIAASMLKATNPLSNLLVLDSFTFDNDTHVLLEFSVRCSSHSASQNVYREWFVVSDHHEHNYVMLRSDWLKCSAIADHVALVQPRRDTPSVSNTDPTAATPPAAVDPDVQRAAIRKRSEQVRVANEERFMSYHPVQNYKLVRSALPPIADSPHHRHSKINTNFVGARRNIKAAVAAIEQEQCFRSYSALQHRDLEAADSLSYMSLDQALAEQLLQFECNIQALEVLKSNPSFAALDVQAAIAAQSKTAAILRTSSDDASLSMSARERAAGTWVSEFAAGDYVLIHGAVKQHELNGQRVRLYSKSDKKEVWHVRLLGKNNDIMVCHEKFLSKQSPLQQTLSRPSSAHASFEDVGIDRSGQPTVDGALLAHRQFGQEYSKTLTARIDALKLKYPEVLSKDITEPCLFKPLGIKLIPNAVLPSKARYYRNTPKMRDEVRRQIQEQLEWKAVERSETPHVSDVLLVKRPHMPGKFRFVVNYTVLNDATVEEKLQMPDAKSQHERLAHLKIFGAVDMLSFYRQIELDPACRYLTGFASDQGTFVYTRVPMGLKNACAHAQKVLQQALEDDPVLGPLGFKNYFDDLPYGANSEDEFVHITEALFQFCARWKLKINPEKSVFGVTSITHVGFVVSETGIAIDPERTRDIAELSVPKSIKKVQSVLGIFNYVRNFIPNFSKMAQFLTDKLSSKMASDVGVKRERLDAKKVKVVPKFTWCDDDTVKFEQLKAAVLNAPLLAYLDYNRPIFIRCDASKFGCGAVLFQYDDMGHEHVACYASRKFLDSETRWSTFQQEASTVVWALQRFHEYTMGYHCIVECDHRNISFVKKSSMPQLARWRLILQEHDFSIRFLQGALNLVSDGLSRQHVDIVEASLHDVVPECALAQAGCRFGDDFAEIAALQYQDPASVQLAPLGNRSVRQPAAVPEVRLSDEEVSTDSDVSDYNSDAELSDADDPVFGPQGQLLDAAGVPILAENFQPAAAAQPLRSAREEIEKVHNNSVGHAGVFTTLQRALRNDRQWASRAQMLNDVDAYIRGCVPCQKMRKRKADVAGQRHTLAGSPFAELSIDVLKLPDADVMGNQYCVVIVDSFSHWTSIVACKNKSAFDAARALLQVIGNFGAPLRLRSDGGSEFVNGVIHGITRLMGVTQHQVLPYTPSANGIVERANRSILERLRYMIFTEHLVRHTSHQWSDLLPLVQRMINASVHSSIGTSPARVLFGDTLDLDRCLLSDPPVGHVFDANNYVDVLSANQRVIIQRADEFQRALCEKVISKMAAKNRGKPARAFQQGDWVLVRPQPSFPLHKLAPRNFGPFRVHQCTSDSEVVVVFDGVKNKLRKFLKRSLELFDTSLLSSVEGINRVAEKDNFEFPVESIIGHSLVPEGGIGADAEQLPSDFSRGSLGKTRFQFLVRWTGYDQLTYIGYRAASRLPQFPGYIVNFPGLAML